MAEISRLSLNAQERVSDLVARLEKQSNDLTTLVQKTPRGQVDDVDDGRSTYMLSLANGNQLVQLEKQLGSLLFNNEDEVDDDTSRGDGEYKSGSSVDEPLVYKTTTGETAPFRQDIEKGKSIGTRRCQRLLVSFEHFKTEQENKYKSRLGKLRGKSGVDKIKGVAEAKERTKAKLEFELNSKKSLLADAASDLNPPDQANSPSYAQLEMGRISASIAAVKAEMSACLKEQAACDAATLALQEKLSLLVFGPGGQVRSTPPPTSLLMNQQTNRPSRLKAKKRRFQASSSIEMLDESWEDLNALLEEVGSQSFRLAVTESSVQLKSETLEVLKRSDEYRELQRLMKACSRLESEIAEGNDKISQLERAILERLEKSSLKRLAGFDSWEAQQAINKLIQRKTNRENALRQRQEARIQAHLPKPKPEAIVVPYTTTLFCMHPGEFAVGLQAASTLKMQMTWPDDLSGEAPKLLTSSQQPDVESIPSQNSAQTQQVPGKVPQIYLKAMHSLALSGLEGESEFAVVASQDYGLQSILEQLQTMEGMLLTASTASRGNRHTREHISGVEEIRSKLAQVTRAIVTAYKEMSTIEKAIKEIEAAENTIEERDILRFQFLRKIGGRDNMPLSITARQDEVTNLTAAILQDKIELKNLSNTLELRRAELADAEEMYSKMKNLPALAAAEVDAAAAAKAAINTETKGGGGANPWNPEPGVFPTSPPTCVPRIIPAASFFNSTSETSSAPVAAPVPASLPLPLKAIETVRIPSVRAEMEPEIEEASIVEPPIMVSPQPPQPQPRPHPQPQLQPQSQPQPPDEPTTATFMTTEPSASGYNVYFYKPRRPTHSPTKRERESAELTASEAKPKTVAVQTLKLSIGRPKGGRRVW